MLSIWTLVFLQSEGWKRSARKQCHLARETICEWHSHLLLTVPLYEEPRRRLALALTRAQCQMLRHRRRCVCDDVIVFDVQFIGKLRLHHL